MIQHYRLTKDHRVEKCDAEEAFYGPDQLAIRRVAFDDIRIDHYVSTVFLIFDHSQVPGEHLFFETMVFSGDDDGYQERYATYDEALAGHKKIVKRLRGDG